jgi:hypothetical protein
MSDLENCIYEVDVEEMEKSIFETEMRLKLKWANDAANLVAELAQSLENSSFESSSDEMAEDLDDFIQKVADVVGYDIYDLKYEAGVEVAKPICDFVSTSIQRVISKFESCLHCSERIDGSLDTLRSYKQVISVA